LQRFISRVHKHCASLVQHLEIDVCVDEGHGYNVSLSEARDLRTLCNWVSTNFTGVKEIMVSAAESSRCTLGRANLEVISAGLAQLTSLPPLKRLLFDAESTPKSDYYPDREFAIAIWMTALLEREHRFQVIIELWEKD
jgi:hypothetical protein